MLRRDVVRLQAAKDQVRSTDIVNILDYLEDIAGASDAGARTAALAIRDVNQISSSDMGRLYDYMALLGTPAINKSEFLNRRMRDRDFMSRRNLEYILDTIDESFGAGTYEAMVFRDGVTSFWTCQTEGASKATLIDSGPNANDIGNAQTAPSEAAGPWDGSISIEWDASDASYDDGPTTTTWGVSESCTFECITMPTAVGDQLRAIMGFGNNTPHARVALVINTAGNGGTLQLVADQDETAVNDPGAWLVNTAYAQGDRVRAVVDDDVFYEAEVAGTSDATETGGYQDGDYGGALTGGTATGLANDATVYTATVTVNGGTPDAISIVGSAAQTYTTLISELDTDTTGATWAINGGELRCTSTATGRATSIVTADTDLFSTLTDFVSFNTAVAGTGEPIWPTSQGSVSDGAGALVWRHVALREAMNDLDTVADITEGRVEGPTAVVVDDTWYHVAVVKDSGGLHLYLNGVLQTPDGAVQVADTDPGSFGDPVRMQYDTAEYSPAADIRIGGLFAGASTYRGRMAYIATYDSIGLTAAQVLDHYHAALNSGMPG